MKTKATVIYNENDGHSYVWSDAECDWIGFPTYADGEPDWLNPTPIEDMEFADQQKEKDLRYFLMSFAEDEDEERDIRDKLDEDEIRTERMIDDNGQLYWHNE